MLTCTILGCGPSSGVPLITGEWGLCNPANPKNFRKRMSLLVEHTDGTTLLVDASPDTRSQLLEAQCKRLDGLLVTHDHFDHTGGLDELRPYYFLSGRKRIPAYMNQATLTSLQSRFEYLFNVPGVEGGNELYPPLFEAHVLKEGVCVFQVGSIQAKTFRQDHATMDSLGLRIGNMAYSTDVVNLTPEMEESLDGLDVWFVDCLNREQRPTHSHLAQTLSWIERFKPKKAYLIHMDRSLDYDVLCAQLPDHVRPAYDGLKVRV
jgi:phosphoribosyl 1,2-cyclic phosphate phosphodiesterase